MDDNGLLTPPANPTVTAIRDADQSRAGQLRGHMDRTTSSIIQEEGAQLREEAEQSLNVILDLDLDGTVRWASPSWEDLVGTSPESIKGKPIAAYLSGEQREIFSNAVDLLRKDDAASKIVRFSIATGRKITRTPGAYDGADEAEGNDEASETMEEVTLEAQGIIIYDRQTGEASHTMWMVRPAVQREITIDLPDILVESLGDGAEMLAQHLTKLAEVGTLDPEHNPPPQPVLCRICERQITPWWFPKHTELCLQEHQADAELQMAQERLTEHRNAIVTVLDALEAQTRYKSLSPAEAAATMKPRAEYKGLVIGMEVPSSSDSSGRESPASSQGSRERPTSGLSHHRARSFAVRRPLSRSVELILDLCDTAMDISQPSLKETRDNGEIRTQSPQSEGRISQVLQYQKPSAATLETEAGLAALSDDTSALARAKVDAVMLCRRILEYSERIRSEYTALVQDCIEAAMSKAARIAAGESSGSDEASGEEAEEAEEEELEQTDDETQTIRVAEPDASSEVQSMRGPDSRRSSVYDIDIRTRAFGSSYDGQSSMSSAMRQSFSRSTSPQSWQRRPSSVMSTRSSSPAPSQLLHPQPSIAETYPLEATPSIAESDAGHESDASVLSYTRAPIRQTRSPSIEQNLSRVSSTRERKRTSLILPDRNRSRSTTRGESPGRGALQPVSPLRIPKPRLPSGALKEALGSPTLTSSEFCSPEIPMSVPHHRRQSSTASSMWSGAALSPRLSIAGPPPRPAAPSIKDFEIIKPISKGAFGSVYLAKKKSTGDYFAIKALKKQDMVAKNQVANVKAERAILMFQGESDFVAKLYWTFPSKDYIFLVMEYMNGGDCASLVRSLGTLPEDWAKRYMAEAVQGVDSLHSREIVHRDLKPDNLLIDQKGHLKLTDFGLSRMGLIGRQKRALSNKSTGSTLAPDPLRQGPFRRSISMTSSRSASFDVPPQSPGSTPTLTPALPDPTTSQPSYFSLSRENSGDGRSRERQSSQQSEPDVEEMQRNFRRFSIYDHGWNDSNKSSPKDVFGRPDDENALSRVLSNSSQPKVTTPPTASTAMLPPPMALFDPDDHNRRFVGTPDYLAPETINGLGQDEMSDWWSLGCILFEFLFGYPPFHAETPDKVFENILHRRIRWPEDDDGEVSAEAKDLIDKLICVDPAVRLGSNMDDKYASGGAEIKAHAWFADIDWDKLNEIEASFVPAPEHPEDTEYFDHRGATLQDFAAQFEDQTTSPSTTPMADYERPHDALSKVRAQVNAGSMKRGLLPLHIPPHVRDIKSRRQSEPAVADDFGQFSYKNLPVLNKSNQDVIQKLKAEAMQAQSRSSTQGIASPQITSHSATGSPSPPSLESSPMIGVPIRRALSTSRGNHRSSSPSTLSHSNSSPSRQSQPSSPLVQFSTGNATERRKTSSGSSHAQSATNQLAGNFFEIPKLSTTLSHQSTGSSPVRSSRLDSGIGLPTSSSPRMRSHTIGSSESEAPREHIPHHHKRRSQAIDLSPSSSDTEDARQKALLRVHRRRQSSRRMSQITLGDQPIFRSLDVLIVEDHPVSRLVMERLMGKLRCRTIVAKDGSEAVRYAMGNVKFDIIMTEYRLPQVNGGDVARMLRETKNANSQTPIVAVTGYLKDLLAPHHFDALIEKPPTTEKLTEVLGRLCQWRPPPPGWVPSTAVPPPLPASGLRKESYPEGSGMGESPVSTTSSGYQTLPSISANSSREDSVSSMSTWPSHGDAPESGKPDDPTVTVTRRGTGTSDWSDLGGLGSPGLGISSNSPTDSARESSRDMGFKQVMPQLQHEVSAPAAIESARKSLRDSRSSDQSSSSPRYREQIIPSRDRANSGDVGDDEDEELGSPHRSRSRSPPKPFVTPPTPNDNNGEKEKATPPATTASSPQTAHRSKHASSLSTEMRITSSDDVAQYAHAGSGGLTPPVIFPLKPGGRTKEISMDEVEAGGGSGSASEGKASDSDKTPRLSQSPSRED